MLPIAASINTTIPIQAPLVNTTIPGSEAARVPYDNVTPSVSNAQVENNTNSNNSYVTGSEETVATAANLSSTDTALATSPNTQTSSGGQAAFLTQLIADDLSPQNSRVILVQYEKLIAFSNVKYKPSNALKPAAEPAGVFGRILQEQKQLPEIAQVATPVVQPAIQETAPAPQVPQPVVTPQLTQQVAEAATAAPAVAVQAVQEPAPKPANDNTQEAAAPAANDNPLPSTPVINAYTQTANRPVTQQNSQVTELA